MSPQLGKRTITTIKENKYFFTMNIRYFLLSFLHWFFCWTNIWSNIIAKSLNEKKTARNRKKSTFFQEINKYMSVNQNIVWLTNNNSEWGAKTLQLKQIPIQETWKLLFNSQFPCNILARRFSTLFLSTLSW